MVEPNLPGDAMQPVVESLVTPPWIQLGPSLSLGATVELAPFEEEETEDPPTAETEKAG